MGEGSVTGSLRTVRTIVTKRPSSNSLHQGVCADNVGGVD
jgi:hypothetical protein